jgi:ABC-2 type transport system ATP-binding protein
LSGHGDGVQGTFLDPANHTCPGYDPRLCPIYVQSAASGSGSAAKAILDNSSPASYFSPGAHSLDPNQVSHGLNVPTLLGQGEADTLFNVNESVASYLAIKARGVPAKMIWHSNGHGYDDQAGEGDVFGNDQTSPGSKYLPQRILAWFDRYLRLDTAVDTGPEFAYFRDWVSYPRGGSAAPAYGASSSWPAEGTATFLLSGSSDLVSPGSPVGAGSVVLQSPAKGLPGAYTETSNFQCPTCTLPTGQASPFTSLQPTNIPGQFADFTSPPFLRDVVSVGVPTAHIHVSNVTNPDVILFGKVWDVDGAGSATLIKRLVAPVRVFDVSRAVDFNLVGFAHLFSKGHRVRFEVAATDLTSTSDHLLPDSVTLTQSAQPAGTSMLAADASTFSLPVDSAGADETVNSGDGRQGTGAHVATPNTSRGGSLGGAAALLAAAALVLARAWRRRPV